MELLFEARDGIGNTEGKVEFVHCTPEVMPEPVMRAEPGRVTEARGTNIYGTVIEDGGRFRMWYQPMPGSRWDLDTALVGYAESDDGINWRKPRVGLVEYGGSKDNNLCNLWFHSPTVFIDPDSPPSHRYRATGNSSNLLIGEQMAKIAGYYSAHSADGLDWHLDSTEPTWPGGDVITSMYHPVQKRGIVSMKRLRRVHHIRRRCIAQAELRDGVWSDQHLALVPDEFDDVCAIARGFVTGDYYGMGMMPAGQGTVGFIWQYRHHPPYRPTNSSAVFGAIDVTLAFQAKEGERWIHLPGRRDFLHHGSHYWNPGGGCTASTPITVGDQTRLYFSGSLIGHAWALDVDFKANEKWQKQIHEGGPTRCIACAQWPKNRLFGFRGAPEGSLSVYLGEITEPSELYINCQADPGGSVRVELIDQDGYALDDCVPLESDHIETVVAWKHGTTIRPPSGVKHVNARLHLDRARAYAYDVRPAK